MGVPRKTDNGLPDVTKNILPGVYSMTLHKKWGELFVYKNGTCNYGSYYVLQVFSPR